MKKIEIRISENQRQYLITAVQFMIDNGYLGASPSERTDIEMLHDMLDDAQESEIVYDFTL